MKQAYLWEMNKKENICIKRESNPRRVDAARRLVATTQVTTTPLMLIFVFRMSNLTGIPELSLRRRIANRQNIHVEGETSSRNTELTSPLEYRLKQGGNLRK